MFHYHSEFVSSRCSTEQSNFEESFEVLEVPLGTSSIPPLGRLNLCRAVFSFRGDELSLCWDFHLPLMTFVIFASLRRSLRICFAVSQEDLRNFLRKTVFPPLRGKVSYAPQELGKSTIESFLSIVVFPTGKLH